MRIKLSKEKQKELILLAKGSKSWKELSKESNINEGYLCRDLKSENRLLSEKDYLALCKITNKSFDKWITQKLEDNWGRSKGGKLSANNTKEFNIPNTDEKLAETFGIILGDGHLSEIKKGNKVRVYCIRITGNSKTDKEYMYSYIPNLFEEVFKEKGSVLKSKSINGCYFTIYGKNIVEFIKSKGINPGNKIENNQGIPDWIKKDLNLLKYCIRGLIDTDGSIHLISKSNKNLRIDYTSYIPKLLNEVREGLILSGFHPSKIINNQHIFLSRQEEVDRYVKDVGFANSKNLNRYNLFKNRLERGCPCSLEAKSTLVKR